MVKKGQFDLRNIDDLVVRDSLSAISALESYPNSADSSLIVGGIAVQSYMASRLRRGTSDIDVVVAKALVTGGDFKEFVKPLVEYFKDNNFSVEEDEKSTSWNIIPTSKKNGRYQREESTLLSFSKHKTRKDFEKKQFLIEKEMDDSRIHYIEKGEGSYRALSPEYIIVPKFGRLGSILSG